MANIEPKGPKMKRHLGETSASAAADQVKAYVARLEAIDQEQARLTADKTRLYGEMRAAGLDAKAIRRLVAKRKRERIDAADAVDDALREYETLVNAGRR